VASEKGHWKPGLWTGRNGLHEERPGIVEDIEDSGLKLGCDNAKEWGRLVEVMAECADRTVEGVRAVGEAEGDDKHHKAGVSVAGRDVRIGWT
jgi:hypothetical protein